MFVTENWSAIQLMNVLSDVGEFLANSTLSHPNVRDLMKYEKNFDAVVVEVFWVEALYGNDLTNEWINEMFASIASKQLESIPTKPQQ